MMSFIRYFFILPCLFLVSLFSACSDDNLVYEQVNEINTEGWNKNDISSFILPVSDSVTFYNLVISVRNRNDYPYSNLYLLVDAISPLGAMVTDTLEYKLADEHGKWLGKGMSKYWDNRFSFRNNIRFPVTGDYKFSIRHGMRDEDLQGIADIGLRLEKLTNN